ncbi:MAG: type II secretion system protein [Planctomycetales bacterium]|nr:type II secretion system protein [Planctomycetales bacterium]
MAMRTSSRRAFSLLELLAVITLIGILSSIVIARNGRTLLGNFGAQADCRRLSLDLLRAQRLSITTGENHFIQFPATTGKGITYRLRRRTATGVQNVESRTLGEDVSVTASHTVMEFTFEGQALGAYQITLAGNARSWQMNVVPITGAMQVTEL